MVLNRCEHGFCGLCGDLCGDTACPTCNQPVPPTSDSIRPFIEQDCPISICEINIVVVPIYNSRLAKNTNVNTLK